MDRLRKAWVDGKTVREIVGCKTNHVQAINSHVLVLVQHHQFFILAFDGDI
jgi:hypothetical protein